jgi:penicillin-binding protein 1A
MSDRAQDTPAETDWDDEEFEYDQVDAPSHPGAAPARTLWQRRFLWIKRGLWAALLLFLAIFIWLAFTAPLSKSLQPIAPPELTLLTSDGQPIARNGANIDAPVKAADLPDHVKQAFIAIEDRRFLSHWGVDPRGVARAFVNNLGDGGTQGGSTITQQLAKITFLTPERSLSRKAREMLIAFWLEAWLTKDEILERYLSNVYFGDNAYGLRAASMHYFHRQPEKLSLSQAALLAGLVQAPSRLAPTKNLKGAQARAQKVLQAMVAAGFIAQNEADAAQPARLDVRPEAGPPSGTYFADWAIPQARAQAEDAYGQGEVKTTLDARLQRIARNVVARAPLGGAQVALVAMRPNGEVVAMIGGKSYKDSPFNRATQARRQPGSTFKLFVYLAAMRSGLTPDTLIEDTEITEGGYRPKNSGGSYRGEITLKQAFAKSSNVAAVRLYKKLGDKAVIQAARDLGIKSPLSADPSLALGTSGVTLLELTSAYAAIAADSYPVDPHAIATDTPGLLDRLLSPQRSLGGKVHKEMLDLLRATIIQGTGRSAGLSIPAYGKTGTSQDNRDALFVGFAGDLVVGVWVGRDDNQPLGGGVHGGGLPARIWRDFMAQAISGAVQSEAPKEEPLPEEPLGNDIIEALPPVEIKGADVDLGQNPSVRLNTDIGGVNVDVNIGRDGVAVDATPPAPPKSSPPK